MIYIDELIFYNFLIDYIILSTLAELLKCNVQKIRIIYSSLLGELLIISLFFSINNYLLFLFKIILGFIMVLTTFGYNDYKSLIKNTIYFFILNYFLGGFLLYLKNESVFKYKYFIFFVPFIMKVYKYFAYNLKNILRLKHKVTIYLNNGKIMYLNGYMDTGNTLTNPYNNKKVIIINKKIKEKFYLVPYKTIDNTSLIKCFNPKKVYIDGIGERNDVCVGIINKKFIGYNCLLNYKLLEE